MWHLPCLPQINSSYFCTSVTFLVLRANLCKSIFPPVNKIRSTFDACFLVNFFVSGDSKTCNKNHGSKDHQDLRTVSAEKAQSP